MTAPPRLPPTALFINRELSWLEFNARVLHEAEDDRVPLLERVKFLSIFSTNLDEFYMVRVAGIRRKVAMGAQQYPPDGLAPPEQLAAIRARVKSLLASRERCLNEALLPALAAHGVELVRMADLTPAEWMHVDEFFEAQAYAVLTPLALDPGHRFPYISNLSLSLAVELRDPDTGAERFARVKVPRSLPRWVPTGDPTRPNRFVPLEEVIGANLTALFPGMEVLRWFAFRITRYSDLDLGQIDQVEDLLDIVERQVARRRFGEVVRVEVQAGMPAALRTLILEELNDVETQNVSALTDADVDESGRLLELGDLMTLVGLDLPDLKDVPFQPLVPGAIREIGRRAPSIAPGIAAGPPRTFFDVIRERDLLVHHPFHSFDATVERFLEDAAVDPNVLAIKCTLYRTSGDTAIVEALTDAAEAGKQVAVLVELQARFDETNNINWARTLERDGVHVAYGTPGLKTHCKTVLVIRRDPDGAIRRYVHIGTGNYNTKTARLYTDLGLFTASPSIGADVSDLFNTLTGYSRQRLYRKLLVAPANLRSRVVAMIEREAAHARAGQPARIIAKMNALVDPETIDALYRASQAGVEIDLIVRGICCIRPGVPGVSDRIRVLSIVGRFLEHARVWFFQNDGRPEYYLGSADWMPRNFDRRVEVITPVQDPGLHAALRALLDTNLADNRQAWELKPDGSYVQRRPADGEPERATHALLLRDPWGQAREASEATPAPPGAAGVA